MVSVSQAAVLLTVKNIPVNADTQIPDRHRSRVTSHVMSQMIGTETSTAPSGQTRSLGRVSKILCRVQGKDGKGPEEERVDHPGSMRSRNPRRGSPRAVS